jgi:hypothetical protein
MIKNNINQKRVHKFPENLVELPKLSIFARMWLCWWLKPACSS